MELAVFALLPSCVPSRVDPGAGPAEILQRCNRTARFGRLAMAELLLHEELLLLALDDDKGTAQFGSMHTYGMAGGIVTELVLRRRIRLEKVKKSLLIDVADPEPTGNAPLDDVLQQIVEAKRRASVQTWVARIAQRRGLVEGTAEALGERGILRREEGRFLRFFRRTTWPSEDAAPEQALVARMRAAIDGDDQVDGRTATIIALAKASGILGQHVDKAVLKRRKQRIEEIAKGNVVGDATREAIEAVTAAMIATTAAVSAATTAAAVAR
jgi:hypothetical protein